MDRVIVINPLGSALGHYQRETVDVLAACGFRADVHAILEPSASQSGRVAWLAKYCRELMRIRTHSEAGETVLVLWPPVGFIDSLLVRILGGRNVWIVVHDPVPLVAAVGFGRCARFFAKHFGTSRLVTHSAAADDAVLAAVGRRTTVVPHPLLDARPRSHGATSARTVRVLGQYKMDRDLDLLRSIAAVLPSTFVLEVVGRGWPPIEGWTVTAEFIDEDKFDEVVTGADVVLIPYRRFFQSGVAIRCVERAVPFVGPSGTSLDTLVGSESEMLVHNNTVQEWADAINYATEHGHEDMRRAGQSARRVAVSDWRRWLDAVGAATENESTIEATG